jgi:hypothetical protein
VQDKQHREQLSFTVLAYGEQLEVVLHRSDDLMSGRYAHVWRDPANGTLVHSRRHAVDHCYYHGKVAGEPRSIVTAHTCGDGIEASLRRESGEHLTLMPGSRVVEMREPPLMPAARRQAQDAKPHRGGQLPPHLVFRSSDQRLPGCPISHLAKVAAPVGYLDGEEFEHFSGGYTPMRLQRVDDGHRGLQTVLVPRGGCSCLDSWAYSVGGVLHEYPQGGCQNPDNDPTGSWCFTENQCGIGGSSTYQYCDEVDASGVPASPPPPPPPPSVAGCRYHVEVMMANDHTAFANMGSDLGAAQEGALMVANGVKEIYQEMSALQICITLVAVRSFTTSADEGSMYTTATDSIENFLDNWSDWYAVNAVEDSEGSGVDLSSDNGVLLTNIDRSGDTTGLGWVGSMCSTRTSSSVVEQNFHGIWQYTAETMAHEMGHNFGSHHDGVGEAAHCDDSEFIMAAVGCSNCGFSQFKAWSSCSETYIQDRLQSLANTPSDCLQNNPRAPVCGSGEESCATCGDFIVSGDEDCDMGTAGSNLCNGADSSSPCRLAAGVVCASGECCDTSTGQFKSPGNLCRDAMHQCDLPDYCSGTSATCGSDLFKADGTACTELGPGSQCYVGSCLGLDGQCGNAFQGYTGTWVAAARNGVQASCTQSYDGCNELLCTNTDWDDYCQVYDCPAGYRCTVDNLEISGPASHSFCSCDTKANLVGDSTQRVLIADGTACGPSDQDNICISNVCTPRPPPSGSASSDTGTGVADVDCVGAWSTCDASCQKLYSVSTQQSGVGAACAAAAGATATCTAGEGMCPPNVDCEGTWSTCSAACTQSYSISQDRSGSGDACEAAAAATRVCAAGTGDCPSLLGCVDASSCSHHGTCARDIQGTLTCACDPGWTGTICTEAFDCPQDCPGLLRHGCISPESCGACLPGHSYLGDNLLPTTACDLLPLSSVDPLSRLSSITANIKAGNSHADSVMDGNIYSHWVADFDDAMRIDQKPRIVMAYSAPVSLTHYSIMSANAHPSEDPESWMLECCSGGSCAEADDFETVDIRTGEMFDNRHQKHVYAIGGGDGTLISCTQVALRIAGIRDAETQGGGTIDATIGSDTIDAETTTSVTTDVSAEFSADVRVAEVEFFRRVTSNSWIDSVPTTAVSASVGLDADFETIGSDPDTDSYRNFVVDFKSDTATLLGVDEAQIVVNSVLAGSVLVDFTVSPDANGRSVTVVALSTAFSAPGVSVAGAMTISTIEPSAVAVTAVSYSASSGGSGTTNLPVSGLGTPEDGEDSIAGQVVFAVLLIVVVLGGACMCHGHLQEEPPPLPPHKGGGRGGGDDYDDVEVAKPVGQEVLQSGTLPSYESNDPEEGMPPPLLPSVARLELARCISSANKASGGGGAVDPAQVHAQFDELDLDRSGGLSQEEIELFVTQSLGYTPSSDYLSGVFAAFDRDGDGTVSEEEFAEMLKTLRRQAEADDAENPLQQP